MLARGNGDIDVCVTNLVSMRRGECAYSRIKGIDQDIINQDVDSAELDLLEDAEFVIEQYEDRVSLEDVEVEPDIYEDGTYAIKFILSEPEDDSDIVDEKI